VKDVFLLFEDTKKTHRGFSFANPIRRLCASRLEDVRAVLAEAEHWQKSGHYVAGYISYEAGWALLPKRTITPKLPAHPLVDLYVFTEKNVFNAMSDDVERAFVHDFQSSTSFEKYRADLEKIFTHLRNGDTYQVNYTQRARFQSTTDAWTTYQTLRRAQRVEYAAFLNLPELQILSFSPELFVKRTGALLKTRPMKGTRARDLDPLQDLTNREFLVHDEKSRAENVMIVDLLRNDLGRLAVPGSVRVPSLFQVEDYETLFQMISEIEAEIPHEKGFAEILTSLFPCGSITGAPKLRTMEIIDELESEPRGVYTGAIGFLEPGGDFCFNVAIRTLVKQPGAPFLLGTGGGILIDSDIDAEFAEAQLKTRFLTSANASFSLFETILHDGKGLRHLPEHLKRLENSARYFGFPFPIAEIDQHLGALERHEPCRVKLSLWNDGRIQVETFGIDAVPRVAEVVISTTRIDSRNIFQRHKTSRRDLYDDQYKKARLAGFYEVLYLNEEEQVAETSRHNIFAKIAGQWCTPPVSAGILPGIERAQTIAELKAVETALTMEDLRAAQEIILTNSVRGRVPVRLRESL